MPYANILPVTSSSVVSIAKYLVDFGHEDHLEYQLTPLKCFGVNSVKEFVALAKANFDTNKRPLGRLRVGPQPKYAANWIIIRTPDHTNLSNEEWQVYREVVLDEAGQGGSFVGIVNLHTNRLSGAADLNVLTLKFDSSGISIRDRSQHPIKNLRARIDKTTRELNMKRKKIGLRRIQTMQEVQRKLRKQRQETDLATRLAAMAAPPLKVADLEPALLSVGCQVTRYNPTEDYVSIIKPGSKKAKKFSITRLLADVAAAISRSLKKVMQNTIKDKGEHD